MSMNKKIITSLGAIAFSLFLTACTGGGNEAPPAQTPPPPVAEAPATPPVEETGNETTEEIALLNDGNPATLTVSWWGNDARRDAMVEALDIFMDRYPHITIDVQYGAWGGWVDNVLTQLAAQVEPDIMQVNYAWVHGFGRGQNVFANLDDFSHILDLSEWTPTMLEFMEVGGELGAVPHGMNGRVIIYNREMLEEFGLDAFPATIEELIAYGEQVAANNSELDLGDNRYAFLNIGPETLDIVLLTMLYNMTGRPMQYNGQMQHTVEEVAAAFEIIGALTDSNTLPTFHQEDPVQNESNPVWTSGRAGGAFEWVSNIFVVGSTQGGGDNFENLGIAVLPTPEGTSPSTMMRPSLGHAISRNSNHPELAAYLLNFLYTDEEALLAIGNTLGVPFARSGAALIANEEHLTEHQMMGLNILNTQRTGEIDPFFEDPNLRQPRFDIIEAFRSGSIDAQTAAERFISQQQAALDLVAG
ncbi:MAG: ABC transporter substrate-binding protein [Defluviitaleaceae bacterium]|nr:ABC transporter substrate-binding protein [Defluviitaleaceae bacterium]